MSGLKRCPFCGGEAVVSPGYSGDGTRRVNCWCDQCEATPGALSADARESWNARPLEERGERAIELLRECPRQTPITPDQWKRWYEWTDARDKLLADLDAEGER